MMVPLLFFYDLFNNMLTNSDPPIANEDPLTHEKIAHDAYEGVGQFFKMSFFGILIGLALDG